MFLDIATLEKNYKKKLESIDEWNYLRNYYRELGKTVDINKKKRISIFAAIKDSFYGFSYWFKKYDFVFFSNNERKLLNDGRFYDVRTDIIIKKLGIDKALLIETPSSGHIKHDLLPINYISSRRFIDFLVVLLEKISKKKHSYKFLDFIHQEYQVSFNYSKQINRFNIQYNIYKILFKRLKPKFIFLVCYYDKQYIIKAAKELGIGVVEIQHGMIGKSHASYFSYYDLDPKYIPDYFLSFGEEFTKNVDNFIYNHRYVYPIGNFYLQYLRQNFRPNDKLKAIASKFSKSIAVSLQWTVEDEMIDYISNVAKNSTETLFILIPREWDEKKYLSLALPNNIIFFPEADCYQIVMHCNFHCTVYSTCAIEALSLGIPNILIDFKMLSSKYLSMLHNNEYTFIAKTHDDMMRAIKMEYSWNDKEILESNQKIISYREYGESINTFIDTIISKKLKGRLVK